MTVRTRANQLIVSHSVSFTSTDFLLGTQLVCTFLFFNFFFHTTLKETERCREISYPVVHSPSSYKIQGSVGLKAKVKNSTWVSHVGHGGPSTWIFISCLRAGMQEHSSEMQQQGLELASKMGWSHPKWQSKLPHHKNLPPAFCILVAWLQIQSLTKESIQCLFIF